MTAANWGIARRIGFRFLAIFTALSVAPFPLDLIPESDWLRDAVDDGSAWLIGRFAESVLGIAAPASLGNGSGDRTIDYLYLLLAAIVAALATIAWSIVDRRRPGYPRRAAAGQRPRALGQALFNPRTLWVALSEGEQPIGLLTVDPTAGSIHLDLIDREFDPTGTPETWRYVRPAPDQLVIDAVHRGASLHVALHRESLPLLVTRGFRWINERPFKP
jgi:hypothetical protein